MDEVMAKAGLFQGVTPEDAEVIAGQFEIFDVPRGTVVFHEGEPGDSLYIVLAGKIKLGRRTAELDLAVEHDVEAVAGLALVEDHRAAGDVDVVELGGDHLGVLGRHALEQPGPRQDLVHVDLPPGQGPVINPAAGPV